MLCPGTFSISTKDKRASQLLTTGTCLLGRFLDLPAAEELVEDEVHLMSRAACERRMFSMQLPMHHDARAMSVQSWGGDYAWERRCVAPCEKAT